MFRKSLMIVALSALPATLWAAGTPEEAYQAAVKAGACVQQGGLASASFLADGTVGARCNGGGGAGGGAAAGLGALVIVGALAGGSSTTTSTSATD